MIKALIPLIFTIFVSGSDLSKDMTACEKGNAESCSKLAHYYVDALEVPLDYKRAFQLFSKSCSMGYMIGCYNSGVMISDKYIKKDIELAKKYYTKACDAGNGSSCSALAYQYYTLKDMDNAYKHFNLGCEAKSGQACSNLAIMYIRGDKGRKDPEKALKLFEKSCSFGFNDGCKNLKKLKGMIKEKKY